MTSGPSRPYPDATLPELISAQALRRPAAVAVRQWQERLTYGELWATAGRLAAALRAAGAGPETPVCVCLRRRPAAVAALVGVQLAGAAYVPLDPGDPPARHAFVAADAGAPIIVADEQTAPGAAALGLPVIRIPAHGPSLTGCAALPDNAAYVLYTSGSTGEPKGVVITHRNLTSYLTAFGAFTSAGQATRAFGFASFGFDVSVIDLFVPLASGGEVELLGEADRSDPQRLQQFCEAHSVTWGCVPVALLPILDPVRLPAWRTLITGAEAPGPEQVERWTGHDGRSGRRFLNCYGPTEATVCVTAFEASGRWERPLPIGTPLANHRVHVVDERMYPVPDGTPGELLIGGAGLARGYLGRPGLTARQFVPDPFCPQPGARLYRTGDIAAWREGALQFLGRRDGQVKIRGRRVELGEVEAVLRRLPAVQHAVVDAVPDGDGLRLVAFCILADDEDESSVIAACARVLPPVLVPSAIIRLARFPLNAAGKVDLGALRRGLTPPDAPTGREPAGSAELAVAAAWRRVLGRAAVSADDDFFASGGHSIAAMRLVADLRSALRRAVSIEDIFGGRTLAVIAERMAQALPLDDVDLVTANPPALSPAQRRLWFLHKLAPDSAAYNISLAERIIGPLDAEALRAALTSVALRHELLRWRIGEGEGPTVEVSSPRPAALDVEDATDETLAEVLDAEASTAFDLARETLWRARLLRLGAGDHVLALTFHHAVFDGWSQRPFYDDLGDAYRAARRGGAAPLPALQATYSDYVAWRAKRDSQRGAADLQWWCEHLADAKPAIDLPSDAARPPVQTYLGGLVRGTPSAGTLAAAGVLAEKLGATLPAVLLAGFSVLLHRLTGQADVVIGTPAADRRHVAFQQLVGFFIEVMPLRVRIDEARDFAGLVRACSDELLAALAHPAAPLDRIVTALGLPRDPGRPPLVQVLFNVYNFPEPRLELDGLRSRRIAPGLGGSPFDLTLYIAPREGGHAAELVYNPGLFRARRAQAFLDCYLELLDALTAVPGRPVGETPLPSQAAVARGEAVSVPTRQPGPEVIGDQVSLAAAGPASPTEHAIASIWREVLGRAEVSATANFFDAGGSSLALIAVRARIAERLGRQLGIAELFQYPSIRSLAGHLQGISGAPELERATARAAARRQRSRRQESARQRERRQPSAE